MKPVLSRLERVPLRHYWPDEARDFTPWLGTEENIALLGETIGIDLEVQEQEARVGPFRADILCRDTATGSLILVENQLERTDHTHLGQLFTYAAGLDAVAVVWIAERFTEEHRAALDWLNRITHEDFHFFGIEVELWQIGDSALAPKFNVVAKPNDWSKTVREAASGPRKGLTEAQQLQLDYWASFGEHLREHGSRFNSPKPAPQNWASWGVGRTGFNLGANVYTQTNEGGGAVYLWIADAEASAYFRLLEREREAIESELGYALRWDEKPGRKSSSVVVRGGPDARDRLNWPELHEWMRVRIEDFDRVFRGRVRSLVTPRESDASGPPEGPQ